MYSTEQVLYMCIVRLSMYFTSMMSKVYGIPHYGSERILGKLWTKFKFQKDSDKYIRSETHFIFSKNVGANTMAFFATMMSKRLFYSGFSLNAIEFDDHKVLHSSPILGSMQTIENTANEKMILTRKHILI